MTDLATALATRELTPFEGQPVIRASIAVTKAGDGLSEKLQFDPVELHVGDHFRLVLDVVVGEIRFKPIKDAPECLNRIAILVAGDASMEDEHFAEEQIKATRDGIRLARENAAGITRLPIGEDDEPHGDDEDESGAED